MSGRLDLSIGQRLGIGFALLMAVIAMLIAAIYHWNARSAAAESVFVHRIAPRISATEALEQALLRVAIGMRAYMIQPDAERLRRHEAAVAEAWSAARLLGEIPKDPDGEALYRIAAEGVGRYLIDADRLVQQAREGGNNIKGEAGLVPVREAAISALGSFSGLQEVKKKRALAAIQDAREQGTRGLAIAGLLAILLFAATAFLTARSIRRPAAQLLRIAGALQQGDWRPALAWAPQGADAPALRDEMTRLAHAFGAAAAALEKREQRLRADHEVAGATASSLLREEIADSALRAICDHIKAEVGVLYWLDEASGTLKPVALRALDSDGGAVRIGEGIPGRAAKELVTVVTRDIPSDSPFSVRLGYDASPPRTVAAVPILFRDAPLGVLLVASLRDLEQESISFLEDAGRQLGVGLQNVKTYERVQQLLSELAEKNQQIQAQNEELQAQNEELQAQSEEIQSQNEELQAQSEEILAQNEQLKDQSEALRTTASSLAEADRRKGEFLGILAHELRNPMAAISNSLYALIGDAGKEQRQRAQAIIRRQTRLLARLVDDLLDITRISSGKIALEKERLDFREIVRECADDYEDAAGKVDVRLDIRVPETEMPVEGDRTRLCQITGNLVDNAIKFSHRGGDVSVILEARNGNAVLRVKDRGDGMEAGMIARLFQPFSQGDSSLAHGRSGLGLGLALAKALAGMHDGDIEARSDGPGTGAEFIVQLPLVQRPAERQAESPKRESTPQAGRRRRILIIEDNNDAAVSLRDALALAGHEIRIARDAAEGIETGNAFCPEVVLCDIGLPDMDGFQVARRLRSANRLKSALMIAVSGYAGPEDRDRAIRAGFDRHLRKPPDIELLMQLLDGSTAEPRSLPGGSRPLT